jgi:hypothetical protein
MLEPSAERKIDNYWDGMDRMPSPGRLPLGYFFVRNLRFPTPSLPD